MKNCNLKEVSTPVQKIADPLTELLRNGARNLIRQAVEAEQFIQIVVLNMPALNTGGY